MTTKVYFNPSCSKCRTAVSLLKERGVSLELVEYMKAPPTIEELDALLEMLGLEPRQLMRTQEPAYRAAGFDDPALDRKELIARMVANPSVIERPIVVHNGRATIGRPPERILDIID